MRLRYASGAVVVLALLALPASASASPGSGAPQLNPLAVQQCLTEKSDLGKKAFRKKYGAKHTMRTCARRVLPEVNAAVPTANSDCSDELAGETPADFIDEYGDDETTPLADAMNECIAEDLDQILNPQDYVDDGTDDGSDA